MERLKPKNPFKDDGSLKEAVAASIASLKEDDLVYPKLASLHLTNAEVKNGLAAILDYQQDAHFCANCPGLKDCPKAQPGFRMDLSRDHGALHVEFFPCHYLQRQEEEERRFIKRDFPDEWVGKDLRSVERSTSTRNPLIKAMLPIIKDQSSRWLYVQGDRKSGKSFILAVYASEVSKIAPGVAFIDTKKTFETLKAQSLSFDEKAKFERNMQTLMNCPLVVFDRFGEEFKSEYVFTKILAPILKYRMENQMLTAFGSRYSSEEVQQGYARKAEPDMVNALFAEVKKHTKSAFDITGIKLYD